MPSASQRAEGSVTARVAMRAPEAIWGRYCCFWASLPASSRARVARTVGRKGPGTRARANSSSKRMRGSGARAAPNLPGQDYEVEEAEAGAAVGLGDDEALPALLGHLAPDLGAVAAG